MSRWKFCLIITLALGLGAVGCGGGAASTVTISVSPATASVVTGGAPQPFTAFVSGSSDQTATWTVTCPTGVTAPACGTIDSNGVYTAPLTVPTVTTSGTTTITPTATITATAHADTSKTATATVTIISGISISITPTTATVGTGEHFNNFAATVNNPGCSQAADAKCLAVTWSVPTATGNTNGTIVDAGIDSNGVDHSVYTAPGTAPSPSTVTITAASAKDPAVTATATVTIVSAATPTLTSVSPNKVGLGSLFQDIYITGTNFISTNNVFVNGTLINTPGPDSLPGVSVVSPTVIRARIPDSLLAAVPSSGILTITVSQQTGSPQNCSPDPSLCRIVVTPVRPAIIGPSPDSIQQSNTGGALNFSVNGGFFGTTGTIAVNATYDGLPRTFSVSSARQMSVNIGGSANASDLSIPGLHPIAVISDADATKFAVTNIAVQPNYSNGTSTLLASTPLALSPGSSPSDVAINPATGIAVVANFGKDSVTLIDLTATSIVRGTTVCTGAVGATTSCSTPSAPKSVAVDYVRNKALVLNTASQSVAVVDLSNPNAPSVLSVTPLFSNPPSDAAQHPPVSIGVNSISGRALVTVQNRPYGLLLDETQTPPVVLGPVSISTGGNSRIAVDEHLNWAIATPGGIGSIGIVDLNRQTQNTITNISRTTQVVTVSVQSSPPLAVQLNDTVFIRGVLDSKGAPDPTFDGFYTVTGLGPGTGQFSYAQTAASAASLPDVASHATSGTVNYSAPVATLALTNTVQGIGINPETRQAIMVDPSPNGASNGVVSFFSLLDQTVSSLVLRVGTGTTGAAETGSVGAAFNPLTNVAVTVNPANNTLSVIDPSALKRLTGPFPTGLGPVAVAVDPATNVAVVANQKGDSISIISLGNSFQSLAITETSPKEIVVNSSLISVASPGVANLTIIGSGFTSNSIVRLDGTPVLPNFVSARELTVTVPPALLTSARRFALDVQNSDGSVSNASDFTVTQSVDVSPGCSTAPLPAGVAIDSVRNIAAVTLSGCNTLALIDLATGTGRTIAVGTNPQGVAVVPRLHDAVVANSASNNASVVDELGPSVTSTISTGSGSVGAAADQDTGEVAVANSVANTVSVVNLASNGASSISVGQRPIAVGFDYLTRQVAAGASSGNSVGIATAPSGSLTASFSVNLPTSVAYDPSTNTFLIASSTSNSVTIYDPTKQQITGSLRIGINPTAIAYNYLTGTLISTNTGSHSITVADLLSNRIRAVLTLPAPPVNSTVVLSGVLQFAVDIHPLTNLAVIADTANGRVLLVPVPR
jgi:DNA-binding beta-propeller fold protein YncE